MRCDVLGPLVVTDDDAAVEIPGGLAAAALCWLAAYVGEPVSFGSLAAVLWPDGDVDPVRVRGVLGQLRSRLPVEVGPSYATLAVEGDAVDAVRFERSLDAAARDLRQGRPDAALPAIEAALGLWRGAPYPELGRGLAALPVVEHLVERHSAAVEELQGLRLRGRVGYELVADLHAEAVRLPERPRRWRQLAVALYRTGRQVEALQVLIERRELARTAEDRELTALYDAILRHDPALERGEIGPISAL